MPIRLKQVHIVNAPSFIDKLHALMKPFMKQEVNELVCIFWYLYFFCLIDYHSVKN